MPNKRCATSSGQLPRLAAAPSASFQQLKQLAVCWFTFDSISSGNLWQLQINAPTAGAGAGAGARAGAGVEAGCCLWLGCRHLRCLRCPDTLRWLDKHLRGNVLSFVCLLFFSLFLFFFLLWLAFKAKTFAAGPNAGELPSQMAFLLSH